MFPERLAVVAEDHDGHTIVEMQVAQPGDHTANLRVIEGNGPVVGAAWITAAIGFGRAIGTVGVIEMEPDQERFVTRALYPAEQPVHRSVAASHEQERILRGARAKGQVIVVDLKAAAEPPHGIQNE